MQHRDIRIRQLPHSRRHVTQSSDVFFCLFTSLCASPQRCPIKKTSAVPADLLPSGIDGVRVKGRLPRSCLPAPLCKRLRLSLGDDALLQMQHRDIRIRQLPHSRRHATLLSDVFFCLFPSLCASPQRRPIKKSPSAMRRNPQLLLLQAKKYRRAVSLSYIYTLTLYYLIFCLKNSIIVRHESKESVAQL